jgi:hypothetical protein
MAQVIFKVGTYNSRRYSKPWIAKIKSWPVGKQSVLEFGASYETFAEVDAIPGDVIRFGQKDSRGQNTTNTYGLVQEDLQILEVSELEARQHQFNKELQCASRKSFAEETKLLASLSAPIPTIGK